MESSDHQVGWRVDLEGPESDLRKELIAGSTDFREAVDGLFSAPAEIDPRPWHRIENQKSMGSCAGHAQSSVCEMAYHIATGEVTQFSPLFAYYAAQKIDGITGDNGSTISGSCKNAMKNGACPLDVMPYPNPVRYTGVVPKEAYESASPFKIRSHSVCKSYDDVKAFIASGQGGVQIGINWGGTNPNSEGVIESFRPGSGGHSVCFLGYSSRKDSEGRNYLWMANSWAETWGNHGWAEVSPKAVDQMFQNSYTVMIGMSDLSTPTPRKIDWAEDFPS